MINLEQKQIFDGRYMQGMQIRVDKITPILEHMQALLLLPKAMRWMGEANFEITAMSDMKNDGSVEINRYVSLRIRVSESSKQGLQKAVREAAEHVRAWLRSISVAGEVVVYDDEGMFGRMPASGYTLVVKDKRAKHHVNPFERLTLPLREGFGINPEEIAEVLCQRPCSGVTLQLSPNRWSYNEVNTLRRYAQGAGISEDRLRRTIDDEIACFTCALWGEGASAIADLLVGRHESGLQVSALQLHQEELVRMLTVDPWTLHRRVVGASRYCGIVMMAEMKSLFHCVPLEIAGLRETLEPDEAVVREIRSLVEKKCAQMLADNEERLSRAQAEMRKTVSESEMRTAQQHEAWMQETKTEARKIADESAKNVLKQVQREQDAMEKKVGDAYDRVTQELDRSKVSFAEQMRKMQRDVDAVRTQQQNMYDYLKSSALLTDEQLRELTNAINSLSAEKEDLQKELLVNTACDAEKPLPESALALLDVSSEDELLTEGLTGKQLAILRIGMNGLNGKPIMTRTTPAAEDANDYHAYVMFVGFLYEQLMRGVYHDKIYAPYYCSVMHSDTLPMVQETELRYYEQGPDKDGSCRMDDWSRETQAARFEICVKVDGRTCSRRYWMNMLTKMELARKTRNKIHALEMDKEDAYRMINAMLRTQTEPCLLRELLAVGRSTVDFGRTKLVNNKG